MRARSQTAQATEQKGSRTPLKAFVVQRHARGHRADRSAKIQAAQKHENHAILRKTTARGHKSSPKLSPKCQIMDMEPEFLERLYPRAVFALSKPAVQDADKAELAEIVDKARLPIPLEALLGRHFPVSPIFFHPAIFEEMLFLGERGDAPAPLGFWPELTIASAVAVVKGSKAIEEILAWLGVARLSYGYAWRVLVDWRHLEQVKGHPAFVEFLRKEDEHAEAIESAIDSGEYPL